MDLIQFNQEIIPKSFDDSFFHLDKIKYLRNIKTLQNIIFFGFEGKRVLINLLLKNIYKIQKVKKHIFVINKIECECLHSDYHIELNIQEMDIKNIDIIIDIIKEYSLSSSILNIPFKIIVIYNFDQLSEKIQYKLRTLVEKLFINTRFILHVKYLSSIIEPLKSRFILIRIPSVSKNQIQLFTKYLAKKYKFTISNYDKIIEQVSEHSIISLSKLICLIFIKIKSKKDKIRYTIKNNNYFEDLVKIIISNKNIELKLNESKELLLSILEKKYDDNEVFKTILFILINLKEIDNKTKYDIIQKTIYYSNITNKTRNVIILETYLIFLITLFSKNNIKK